MFGRTARLPVDINTEACDPQKRLEDFECYEDPSEEHVECERHDINDKVKFHILKAQKKQKEYYDKKHKTDLCFNVGSLVLKKDFRRKKRRGGKLDFRWNGPYKIVSSLGRGLFKLEENSSGKIVDRVNGVHLKKYFAMDSDDYPFLMHRQKTLSPLPLVSRSIATCKCMQVSHSSSVGV
jgi:hypothetical protein